MRAVGRGLTGTFTAPWGWGVGLLSQQSEVHGLIVRHQLPACPGAMPPSPHPSAVLALLPSVPPLVVSHDHINYCTEPLVCTHAHTHTHTHVDTPPHMHAHAVTHTHLGTHAHILTRTLENTHSSGDTCS